MAPRQTIPHTVLEFAERSPERELMTFRTLGTDGSTDDQMTYEGLWLRAAVFAERLREVPRGGRVLIVLPIGNELFAGHFGSMLAGCTPIIHAHPSPKVEHDVYLKHLEHVLSLSNPAFVITNTQFAPPLLASGYSTERICIAEQLPTATHYEPTAWRTTTGHTTAVIQHSSGSTGLQKGVALSHEMVQRQCESYAHTIKLSGDDRVCSWLPIYHDMGLFTSWLMPLLSGVPIAAVDPFAWVNAPASFLRLISDFHGTLAWQPNFAYNLLALRAKDHELEGVDLSPLRGLSNCSEPVRASSHDLFYERFREHGLKREALWVCYAMAENAFAVTAAGTTTVPVEVCVADSGELSRGMIRRSQNDRKSTLIVSCGSPIPDCHIKIVDDQRSLLPDGRVGEVALTSPYQLREYYRNIEETRCSLDAEGWYYTGDLGFILDKQLYITGRKKDLIIIGGRNFYPQDIEALCDSCAGAMPGRTVAIGVEDHRTGTERLVILVESQLQDGDEQEKLKLAVRGRVLDDLDCPVSEVHVVPHMWLQKTTSGKIARRPNLKRYREFQTTEAAKAQEARKTATFSSQVFTSADPPASIARTIAWGAALAVALYIIFALQPNFSWGLYAGF